jgi:hypothetical protein
MRGIETYTADEYMEKVRDGSIELPDSYYKAGWIDPEGKINLVETHSRYLSRWKGSYDEAHREGHVRVTLRKLGAPDGMGMTYGPNEGVWDREAGRFDYSNIVQTPLTQQAIDTAVRLAAFHKAEGQPFYADVKVRARDKAKFEDIGSLRQHLMEVGR